MTSVDRLIELLAIAEAGSITLAAERLGMRRETLSRRLTGLETEMGLRLIHRNSRSMRLTHAGELLVERARIISSEVEATWRSVLQLRGTIAGPLRVSTPPANLFQDLLLGFAIAHPEVRLLVTATSQPVDLLTESIDVALRFGEVTNEGLIARKLPPLACALVASPAYLEAFGVPDSAAALDRHRCILVHRQAGASVSWPLRSGGRRAITPHFACDGLGIGLRAALAGLGIALMPTVLTASHRESGRLVGLLEETVGFDLVSHVVYPDRRPLAPAVRVFIDHTVAHFSGKTTPEPGLLPDT